MSEKQKQGNCPLRKQDNVASTVLVGTGHSTGADEDDFHTLKRMNVEVDMEERAETKAKRQADVKMGVMSKTIKSFATVAPSAAKKKVVVF
ncbi:hypothetical protein M0805_008869 [Coniferiporia weirii]|nr:hypothetical protein M0805_008869 [Coniferiporia weirii]